MPEAWLTRLQRTLPAGAALRRLPLHADDDRLLGGLDLAATLATGRPVRQAGLLAQAAGGLLLLPMAERLPPRRAAQLAAALDDSASRLTLVAFDDGLGSPADGGEAVPAALAERLGLWLHGPLAAGPAGCARTRPDADLGSARRLLAAMRDGRGDDGQALAVLVQAAQALGIGSLRAPLLALRVARAAAALAGRGQVGEADLALAAQLVLAPRATRLPAPPEDPESAPAEPDPPPPPADAEAPDGEPPPPSPDRGRGAAGAGAAGRPGGPAARAAGPAGGRHGAWPGRRRQGRGLSVLAAARPAGGLAPRRPAHRRAAAPDRHAARGGALAGAAPARARGRRPAHRRSAPAAARAREARRPAHRAPARAPRDHHGVRRRCLGLGGAAPPGRGQGRGGAAAGRVLRAPRPRGADRLPRPRRPELLLPPTRSLVRAKRSLAGCPAAAARRWPPAWTRRARGWPRCGAAAARRWW
jgi:magnesium chelatase subunit D